MQIVLKCYPSFGNSKSPVSFTVLSRLLSKHFWHAGFQAFDTAHKLPNNLAWQAKACGYGIFHKGAIVDQQQGRALLVKF